MSDLPACQQKKMERHVSGKPTIQTGAYKGVNRLYCLLRLIGCHITNRSDESRTSGRTFMRAA